MHRPPPQMSVPSSIWPLQLLSTPSHTSVVGGRPPTHSRLPFTQKILPFWQLPTSEPHGWPTPGTLSSMMPLQSSSRPLHTSGVPPVPPEQTRPSLPMHVSVPGVHTPGRTLHGVPAPGTLLSICPSQSLSSPSQISGVGSIWPRHCGAPWMHTILPCLHSP